tara:strand:- start:253 stop:519 length:267 start_codon:yes stop_codon:yes gene_type:complete
MNVFTESFINEAQANIVRIQGEVVADTTTYWAINERLQCVYDGDTTAQYDDMMLQLKALNGISLGNRCILGIEADIERHIADDLKYSI